MENINILCATDQNFSSYCGIMLTSLFENNKYNHFTVFIILSQSIDIKTRKKFNALGEKYNQKIILIDINEELLRNCPIHKGDTITTAAYYRILATQILPNDIDKVLYLDADIIIDKSIESLWNENLDGYSIGCVIDPIYKRKDEYERLDYDSQYLYFNSGVLLINLKYWREHKITEQCFDFIENHRDRILWHDQDVLNKILHGTKKLLPLTYNFQSFFLLDHQPWAGLDENVIDEINKTIAQEPIIIHYSSGDKPWIKWSYHPYVRKFFKYKHLSLWKNTPFIYKENFSFKNKCFYYLYTYLGLFHNDKYRFGYRNL